MNYFKDCNTPEEAKILYKKQAKKLHPDMPTGDKVKFQEMEEQYRLFLATSLNEKQKDFSNKAQYMNYLETFFMDNPELLQTILNSLTESTAFKNFIKKNASIIDAGINFYQFLKQKI